MAGRSALGKNMESLTGHCSLHHPLSATFFLASVTERGQPTKSLVAIIIILCPLACTSFAAGGISCKYSVRAYLLCRRVSTAELDCCRFEFVHAICLCLVLPVLYFSLFVGYRHRLFLLFSRGID